MSRDVRIYVDVYVKNVGVYTAEIKIVTFEDDEIVYNKSLDYPRRTYANVYRHAYNTARKWCALHGYEEIDWEDYDEAAM